MAGEFDYTPEAAPKHGRAYRTRVAVYDPDAPSEKRYRVLPNVQVEQIQYREGAEPPTARFRYVLDDRGRALGWPTQYETILRIHQEDRPDAAEPKPEKAKKYVVGADERIVVLGLAGESEDSDEPVVLFDGFAQSPQVDLSGGGQNVTFIASGVAIRLWDEPIGGRMRAKFVDDGGDGRYEEVWTNLPTIFNPRSPSRRASIGNRDLSKVLNGGREGQEFYPFEADHPAKDTYARAWNLAEFAKYLMGAYNAEEKFVENPDFAVLKILLEGRRPREGAEVFDPNDESTYDKDDITLPEFDATGMRWPEALNSQLSLYGFAMAFRTENGDDGEPWNYLEIYRKDGSGPYDPKSIPQQRSGETINPSRNAIGSLSIARDYQNTFNAVTVMTPPSLFQIRVVLAPAFMIRASDIPSTFVAGGSLSVSGDARDMAKYRLWVGCDIATDIADASNGDYVRDATTQRILRLPWLDVSNSPDAWGRRRPGSPWLLDDLHMGNGERRRAKLEVSTDYKGEVGTLFDPEDLTSTWRTIPWGRDWELLDDRLGILITADDPNAWNLGHTDAKESSGLEAPLRPIIRVVKSLANPDEANPPIFLRLTTVIEGDNGVNWVGDKYDRRDASLLKYSRHRWLSAGSAFRNEYIHVSALHPVSFEYKNAKDGLFAKRDDQDKLDAYARQIQQDGENPSISGKVTIPWISRAYTVGDQIKNISGRGLSLTTNAGAEQGESPRHPYVVGVDWSFSGGGQATTLHLSDRRAEPRPSR